MNRNKFELLFWMMWCCTGIGITLADCCICERVLSVYAIAIAIYYVALAASIWFYRSEEKPDEN